MDLDVRKQFDRRAEIERQVSPLRQGGELVADGKWGSL
jgi:hypothetical protein